jgi:hypothetical protein
MREPDFSQQDRRMTKQRIVLIAGALAAVVALAACSTGIFGGFRPAAVTAPNVDVYVMVDTSPSMEIAATSDGMATLTAATLSNERGCALGCHESNPDQGAFQASGGAHISCTAGGAYADGTAFTPGAEFPYTGRDNDDLARCLGVALRIDRVRDAVQNLVQSAGQTEKADNATYRMALFETDTNQADPANDLKLYTLLSMTGDLSPGGAAYAAAGTIAPLEMYRNNSLVEGDFNFDMDTYLDADIASMNGLMPAPGHGAHRPGDRPQAVLLIVTDGLNDQTPRRTYSPMDWSGVNCAAIRKRGVRIAVLYTTYVPLGDDPWYRSQVAPALPKGLPPGLPPSTPVGADPMALAAQQCASPGLYEQVNTDGDISATMQTLFGRAVKAGAPRPAGSSTSGLPRGSPA